MRTPNAPRDSVLINANDGFRCIGRARIKGLKACRVSARNDSVRKISFGLTVLLARDERKRHGSRDRERTLLFCSRITASPGPASKPTKVF